MLDGANHVTVRPRRITGTTTGGRGFAGLKGGRAERIFVEDRRGYLLGVLLCGLLFLARGADVREIGYDLFRVLSLTGTGLATRCHRKGKKIGGGAGERREKESS